LAKEGKVSEDVAELREVLNVISEFIDKLPKILNELISALYAADIGEKLGKSVGEYYKKLKESGIPDDVAIKLTEAYAKEAQTPMKILGELISRFGGGRGLREELEELRKRRLEESKEKRGGAEETEKS
jgi:dissimilatory sulfite reductase (desulfoviridin) alpha/beta subunit